MKAFIAVVLAAAFAATSAQLRWTRLSDGDGPGSRQGAAMAYDYVGNRLVIFGGLTNESTYPNDVWTYDVDSGDWSQVINETTTENDAAPPGRQLAYSGIVTVDGTLMLVVVFGIAGVVEYDDVWVFRLDTYEWTSVTIENMNEAPLTRYGGNFGAVYGSTDSLWMGGGFTLTTSLATRYSDLYKLVFSSRSSARWEELYGQPSSGNQFNPLQPHGRCLQGSAVVEEEKIVLFGGCMRYVDNQLQNFLLAMYVHNM